MKWKSFGRNGNSQSLGFGNEMKQILSQLKITNLSQAKMETLSGGQIKRVALAKLLTGNQRRYRHIFSHYGRTYQSPGRGNGRMARKLSFKSNGITLLFVTHDRYFLDSVCDTIWEMEDKNLYFHNGSYATYLENKMIREDNLNATIDKGQ